MTVLHTRPSELADHLAPTGDQSEVDLFLAWNQLPARIAGLASERATAESETRAIHESRVRRAELALRDALNAAETRAQAESADVSAYLLSERQAVATEFASESEAIEAERQGLRRTTKANHRRTVEAARSAHDAARWEAGTMFEAVETGASEWLKETGDHLANETQAIEVLKEERDFLRSMYRGFLPRPTHTLPEGEARSAGSLEDDPFPSLRAKIKAADGSVLALEKLKLPMAFRGPRMAWVFVLPSLVLAYPAWRYLGSTAGAITVAFVSAAIGFVLRGVIVKASRASILALLDPLEAQLAEATALVGTAEAYVQEVHRKRLSDAVSKRNREWANAAFTRETILPQADALRDEQLAVSETSATGRVAAAVAIRDRRLVAADEVESRRAREIASRRESDTQSAKARHQAAIIEAESKRVAAWESLAYAWSRGLQGVTELVLSIRASLDPRFPEWSAAMRGAPLAGLPFAIRFGEVAIDLKRVEHGISTEDRLRVMTPDTLNVPAISGFPEHSSIAFEFAGESGRKAVVDGMSAVMLRFLTGLPPGKVRLTMLDPVGLGRSFAGFMHLADYSEALVNSRIWTEPQQIDARLAELNSHVELVIQNYLRNEFLTIEAYNEQAAKVAEPYRVLVVPDFPAGFTEATARRLLAIAKSGPRCGVYVILGFDTTQTIPPSVSREELLKWFVRLVVRDGRFTFRDPAWSPFALTLDPLPESEAMTQLVYRVGEAAKAANRVEVPFEVIAPKPEDYWKGDSRSEVVVPLGRSGATKLQALHLGRGTSQHALIAGRTGSGKSTLLHALITNSALIYGPDELELYLIDFKKGVEFKTYATHGLPHARVVAIESEREFGLSVLQRLDAELKVRGDLYRDLGVQDVAGFRTARPDQPMPRILLIVDEFQEFFVEDDKLAQECSLLLDRLVRQGRAFGVHVQLGSQTLGGAYSLARSTLGQMAIRIALQCSEADAHLILNEDNSAARLLSRPGEAIYNDANGQVEGNHTFQVVWLPDARREQYLRAIARLARERGVVPRTQIVFEGNRPADLNTLAILREPRRVRTGTVYAWLGEAVAIKDPTAATFRAQGGKNLLILGQNAEMAAGILNAVIVGLSAQIPDESHFLVLDGTPDDSGLRGTLARSLAGLPQITRVGESRDTAAILGEAVAEIERRQAGSGDVVPWFVLIHDLPRFRDLRKSDDDLSFSSRRGEEKVVSPAKLLSTILREGPALGVHAIVWCDSLNNANRAFDRAALREFEMRVLFQMSASDSSNLIDSPAASRLGENRAFFSSEDEGKLEKFRPFGLPSTIESD